jgi:hypothetical protein
MMATRGRWARQSTSSPCHLHRRICGTSGLRSARAALDSLQISVGGRWRRWIQATSVLVATAAAVLIQLSRPGDSRWLFIISAALIGGPLAWTIRDATAVLERWRR